MVVKAVFVNNGSGSAMNSGRSRDIAKHCGTVAVATLVVKL